MVTMRRSIVSCALIFAALFLFVTPTLADETLYYNGTFDQGYVFDGFGGDSGTTTMTLLINDDIFTGASSTRVSEIHHLAIANTGTTITYSLYKSDGTRLINERAGSVNLISPYNYWFVTTFDDDELTATNCATDCTLKITANQAYSIQKKDSPQRSDYRRDSNSYTPSGYIYGTTTPQSGGSGTSTENSGIMFVMIGASVASTSCVTTATTAVCNIAYLPEKIPATPENFFYLMAIFVISFIGTYWLIYKLT